jgi:hypothetical protein
MSDQESSKYSAFGVALPSAEGIDAVLTLSRTGPRARWPAVLGGNVSVRAYSIMMNEVAALPLSALAAGPDKPWPLARMW